MPYHAAEKAPPPLSAGGIPSIHLTCWWRCARIAVVAGRTDCTACACWALCLTVVRTSCCADLQLEFFSTSDYNLKLNGTHPGIEVKFSSGGTQVCHVCPGRAQLVPLSRHLRLLCNVWPPNCLLLGVRTPHCMVPVNCCGAAGLKTARLPAPQLYSTGKGDLTPEWEIKSISLTDNNAVDAGVWFAVRTCAWARVATRVCTPGAGGLLCVACV